MHIEFIGSTSAGKTTLAKKMVEAGKRSGIDIVLSDDFMLEQLKLSWVKNEFIRRRLVEVAAFALCLTCIPKYKDFFRFVMLEGKSSPGSWFYKINRIRNVLRKIGIFEFISLRRGSRQIVLADNEGILQGIHNLFVHPNSQTDLNKIAAYVGLVPLPDAVLYLQQTEDVLVSRTLARGHARVPGSSSEEVAHFIKQAVAVFDEVVHAPELHDRLLIVDGEMNILSEQDRSNPVAFHQVTELVPPGN